MGRKINRCICNTSIFIKTVLVYDKNEISEHSYKIYDNVEVT